MAIALKVAGTAFLLIAVGGLFLTLPMAALTAAFFGLVLLALAALLSRIGPKR